MQTSGNPSTQPQPLSAPVLREPNTSVDSAYAYYVLAVLFVVYIFNFIDRQILAILLQPIKEDLKISDSLRDTYIVKPGDKFSDYIKAPMPAADAQEWFGKPPPDLSLVARSRGSDWIFNFLTTFYADQNSRQTGVNNLQLPGTAMPHVLASVQGVKNAVWTAVEHKGEDGKAAVLPEFKEFEAGIAGSLTDEQYDEFARDIVNFLQYASDPTQVERQGIGIWVVLFLLMFTGIAYMLKKEYWKDVR